jgi:hypothetical protein
MSWLSLDWAATTSQTAAVTALHPFDRYQRFLVIFPHRPRDTMVSYALSYRSGDSYDSLS